MKTSVTPTVAVLLLLASCTAPNPNFSRGADEGSTDYDAAPPADAAAADAPTPAPADISAPRPDLLERPDLARKDLTSPLDLARPDLLPRPCTNSLANVGAMDFTIAFTIQTRVTAVSTVLHQRRFCNATVDFWAVSTSKGMIYTEILQASQTPSYALYCTTVPINDGNPHRVVIQRRNGVLLTSTDGVDSGGGPAAQSLADLPKLGIGSGNPCEGVDGTLPLTGVVTDVCITIP